MKIEEIISSGLLELYAMGLTSPEETASVESWLAEYPEVKAELGKIELSLESYAQAHAIAPASSVKAKVFASIKGADETRTVDSKINESAASTVLYRIPFYYKLAAAAAIILLLGSAVLNYTYYARVKSANNELQVAHEKIAQMDSVNLAMNKDIDVMTDKNSRPVVLTGTPNAPDALAKIFWMKNTGEVYIDPSNLPAAPAGKQYQLWAIIDGKPVDAGMISTEKGIYHIQKMKSFGHVDAFAVTLEKTGGSKAPEGEMFVISKI